MPDENIIKFSEYVSEKYAEFLKILGVLFLKYGMFLVKTRCEFSDKSQKILTLSRNDRPLCYT